MNKNIRKIVSFCARIITYVGILVVIFGCYTLYNQVGKGKNKLYSTKDDDFLKQLNQQGFIVLGCFIIIIGIAGIQGSSKKSQNVKERRCSLAFFQIGAIVFLLLFTGLAIFTLVYSDEVFGKEQIDDQLILADQLFCSPACQCFVKEETLQKFDPGVFQGKSTTQDESFKDNISVEKCSDFEYEKY